MRNWNRRQRENWKENRNKKKWEGRLGIWLEVLKDI